MNKRLANLSLRARFANRLAKSENISRRKAFAIAHKITPSRIRSELRKKEPKYGKVELRGGIFSRRGY